MSPEFTGPCDLCRHPGELWSIEINGVRVLACDDCCRAREPENTYPRCEKLALYALAGDPRAKDLGPHDFRIHVQGLAEEIQTVIENYSLPKDDRDE